MMKEWQRSKMENQKVFIGKVMLNYIQVPGVTLFGGYAGLFYSRRFSL
jgi:hypothetical protein